jgi:hypothetical protein
VSLNIQPAPRLTIGERMVLKALQRRQQNAVHREVIRTRSTDLDEASFDRALKGLVHKQLVIELPTIEDSAENGKPFHGVSGQITLTMRGYTMRVK